jgi:hypothetical protein
MVVVGRDIHPTICSKNQLLQLFTVIFPKCGCPTGPSRQFSLDIKSLMARDERI